jgi:hypothetical protein
LSSQVGGSEVPVLKDDEFTASHGRAGRAFAADRRFLVDRRQYDRTILEHAQRFKLDSVQIENAVMAARAFVQSRGQKQILLLTEGEKALAKALSGIIRLAETREGPREGVPYGGANRRHAPQTVQEALADAVRKSGLDQARRDKVIRAFRVINKKLRGTFDRQKMRELIQRGLFTGFNRDEIALVEKMLRIQGYAVD